jgi:hypothetical protein
MFSLASSNSLLYLTTSICLSSMRVLFSKLSLSLLLSSASSLVAISESLIYMLLRSFSELMSASFFETIYSFKCFFFFRVVNSLVSMSLRIFRALSSSFSVIDNMCSFSLRLSLTISNECFRFSIWIVVSPSFSSVVYFSLMILFCLFSSEWILFLSWSFSS